MNNYISQLKSISSNGLFVAAIMFSNFINFAFNAILGRVLTLEEFSFFTVANTLWSLILILVNSVANTTTNRTAYLKAKRGTGVADNFRNYILKHSISISLIFTLIWLALMPVFLNIFHISNYLIFISIAPVITLGISIAVVRGHLQGSFSFIKASMLILTESISKLLIALLLVYLSIPNLVYLSIPLSILVTFIVSLFLLKHKSAPTKQSTKFTFPSQLLFATFLTICSSASFMTFDLLLARHFLSDTNSGAYALLSLVGKMVFFLGSLLNVFILTFASRDTGLNKNSTSNFYKILGINIVGLSSAFILLGTFGNSIVPFLFGQKSVVIIEYLVPYLFSIILFTIATSFASYHLAKQQYLFAYNGLIATLLLVGGILLFNNLISDFVNVIAIVSFIYFSLTLIFHIFYKDISEYVDVEDKKRLAEFEKLDSRKKLSVSICLPAYNEGRNIAKLLTSLLNQKTKLIRINKILVISSASTDNTDSIVQKFAKVNKKIMLITEKERNGKATAINKFLQIINDPIVVVQSADTLPKSDTIEKLCRPFLIDEAIGMTGGAPIPVNNPNSFLGYVVHTWWWFHRNIPRFGEIIAFRNIIDEVSPRTSVDEAYVQAKFAQLGYKVVHIDEAQVYNKGSESIRDMIKQRRRIFNGHKRLMEEEHIHISTVTKSGIKLLLFDYKLYSIDQVFWLIGGIMIEAWANVLGYYDKYVGRINPVVWDIATTTKDLSPRKRGDG